MGVEKAERPESSREHAKENALSNPIPTLIGGITVSSKTLIKHVALWTKQERVGPPINLSPELSVTFPRIVRTGL